jgi:hypothetical protein
LTRGSALLLQRVNNVRTSLSKVSKRTCSVDCAWTTSGLADLFFSVTESSSWKENFEESSASSGNLGCAEVDSSFVTENERSGDPKAETGSLQFFCRKKGVEDAALNIAGNPRSVVTNRDAHTTTVCAAKRSETNDYRRFCRRRFDCVSNKISEHLAQLAWKCLDPRSISTVEDQANFLCRRGPLKEFDYFSDKIA